MRIVSLPLLGALLCIGCAPPQFELVPAGVTRVGVSRLLVNPGMPWNHVPFADDQRKWETVWTQNGPLLDVLSLVGGLPEGKTLIKSYEDDLVQVPAFRADMSAEDLESMVRASYLARGIQAFDVEPPSPAQFMGGDGVRFGFRYTPEGGTARRGICVMRTVDKTLYALTLDAESTHYFGALLPEFERLVASAKLRRAQ